MYLHHGNMIIHILHFIPTATLWVERFTYGVCWEGLIFNFESLKMDNLNCCSGGRFLLILWRVLLQMGWLTFIDVLSSSFFFFSFSITLIYLRVINVFYGFVLSLKLYFLPFCQLAAINIFLNLEECTISQCQFCTQSTREQMERTEAGEPWCLPQNGHYRKRELQLNSSKCSCPNLQVLTV